MKNRTAFTMIELIFVIVIIALLSAIMTPTLVVTRDDAIKASLKANTRICINDLISGYKGKGNTVPINSSEACRKAIDKGAIISYTNNSVRVSGVNDALLDGDHVFKGTRVIID